MLACAPEPPESRDNIPDAEARHIAVPVLALSISNTEVTVLPAHR
jgi:hypothetical protein